MTHARQVYAFTRQLTNINLAVIEVTIPLTGLPGAQHLFNGLQKPVAVSQHHIVKLLPLMFVDIPFLQRLEIKTNRGERYFEFMSYGVDEGIVLLVAADLTNEEGGVEYQSGNNNQE